MNALQRPWRAPSFPIASWVLWETSDAAGSWFVPCITSTGTSALCDGNFAGRDFYFGPRAGNVTAGGDATRNAWSGSGAGLWVSGAGIWLSAAVLELGISFLVPFSEGLWDVGGQILSGELGTGSDAATVMTEGQWNNIYCVRHSGAHSRTNVLWHFSTSSHPRLYLPRHKSVSIELNPFSAWWGLWYHCIRAWSPLCLRTMVKHLFFFSSFGQTRNAPIHL